MSSALLAVSESLLDADLASLLVLTLVAAIVPIAVGLLRLRIAEVVLLLAFGVIVGPQVLGLVHLDETLRTFNELGLGLLFFLAGYELDRKAIEGESGRLALIGWATSILLAFIVVSGLWLAGIVSDLAGVAIALASTALGTLLPVVRDRGLLHTRFGMMFMGAGAAGEFGPILAIAILLGSGSFLAEILLLALFAVFAVVLYLAPGRMASGRLAAIVERGEHTSSQTAVRWTMVLLLGLLLITAKFGFDAVLGAFVAGVILRRYSPVGESNRLTPKMEAIGFGFFIPLFFVMSGANLDINSIIANPLRLLMFFALLLAVRGVPQYFLYRKAIPDQRERSQFTLYVATALPILVAITSLEVSNGFMRPENGAALVGAGALSVLVFPMLGDAINKPRALAEEFSELDVEH